MVKVLQCIMSPVKNKLLLFFLGSLTTTEKTVMGTMVVVYELTTQYHLTCLN